jgi:hypothetical protein
MIHTVRWLVISAVVLNVMVVIIRRYTRRTKQRTRQTAGVAWLLLRELANSWPEDTHERAQRESDPKVPKITPTTEQRATPRLERPYPSSP